jgi:hypothetical protein
MTRYIPFGSGLAIRNLRTLKEPTDMRPIPKSFVAVVLVGYFVTAIEVAGEPGCDGPYR